MLRRPLIVLGALTALMSAGYGAMFALLGDYRDRYGIPESQLGLVIGTGFLSGFVSQLLVAPLADRGSARRVVLIGSAAYFGGTLLMGTSTTVGPMIAGRLVMGLGVGAASPAMKRIVILADRAHLGHSLGVLLALDVGGFAAGPALAAGLAGPFGLKAPFVVIATASAAVMVLAARLPLGEARGDRVPRLAFDLLGQRAFLATLALGCSVFAMIGVFDALWSVAMKDLGAARWLSSLGITLFALPIVLFGPRGGRLAQRVGPFRLAVLGLAAATVCMTSYGLVGSAVAMFTVAMVHSTSDAFTVSSTSVAAGMVVGAERQASAQGMMGGAQTLTAGGVSAASGWLYQHHGRSTAYVAGAAAMTAMWVAGAVLARPVWRLRGPVVEARTAVPSGA